ncbi:MAG: Flp family type IVb pilin [Deltaproteobacteria bacterium]|nr:Flp family type IVb pilin [Deltaproteobacteria bacterium]
MNHLITLIRDEEGTTAIEYALIAGLVAIATIVALTALGTALSAAYTNIGTEVTNAATP